MRRALTLTLLAAAAVFPAPALAGGGAKDAPPSLGERVEDLQQQVDSLTEDIEDLQEPLEEFELYDQCAYTLGATQHGTWGGPTGFLFGPEGTKRRPALALDMRGFGAPRFNFLAFPAEEPPSIECNEDAGEEEIDG